MDLDRIDLAIIRALQANGRLSNADLAEKVGLSPSACLRRVRTLEESGLIAGYVMLLNQQAAGFPGRAFVQITLDKQNRETLERFERAVAEVPDVLACYLLAGQADYLLHIVYRDSNDLERIHAEYLTHLPGVVRVQSTLTLRTVKCTTALPI
jgi:Lrp/AsnC family transcriptional regulator, leucine-responsive regulatory protein